TVIPLFCAKFLTEEGHKGHVPDVAPDGAEPSELLIDNTDAKRRDRQRRMFLFQKIVVGFNRHYHRVEKKYDQGIAYCLRRPGFVTVIVSILVVLSLALYPFLNLSFFPR